MLAHFAHHLVAALLVPLLPLIRKEFALGYTQSGLVSSVFTLSYGFSQLLGGWLADRIGPRILITIGISGVALAGLLVGLSQTYVMMLILLGLMGMLGGGYHPSAAPLVSATVESKNRGQALGLHLVGGTSSFFLGPLIAAATATAWGWRGSFIAVAIPAAALGLILYVLMKRLDSIGRTQPVSTELHDAMPQPSGRWRRLVAFIVLSLFTQAVTGSVTAFIPLFMVDHFSIGEAAAAAFMAIIFSAGPWAGPLGGYLSDRLGRIPMILAIPLLLSPAIYLLNVVPYGLGFGALLLVIGIATTVRMPVSEAYLLDQSLGRYRSTILGIYYFSGMEVGAIFTPLMGFLIDRLGFYNSFSLASATIFIVALICSPFLRGQSNR